MISSRASSTDTSGSNLYCGKNAWALQLSQSLYKKPLKAAKSPETNPPPCI